MTFESDMHVGPSVDVNVQPGPPLNGDSAVTHNGAVPTLEALLEPTDARPVTFTLGEGAGTFVFDTRLPGNRNTGHEFGVALAPDEKRDLVAFLKSL